MCNDTSKEAVVFIIWAEGAPDSCNISTQLPSSTTSHPKAHNLDTIQEVLQHLFPNNYMYSIKLKQKGKQKCFKCHSKLICVVYYNKNNKITSKVPHYVSVRCGSLDYQTRVLHLSLQC
jgi:hypothetical protein